MANVNFYFETLGEAGNFCRKHGIPYAAVTRTGSKRCEVSVPAEWSYGIRAAY